QGAALNSNKAVSIFLNWSNQASLNQTNPKCCDYFRTILSIFAMLICGFGILGNGMVIWLLGFFMKRKSFTTYILNLAIADFCFLVVTVSSFIYYFFAEVSTVIELLFHYTNCMMFTATQFLLTVISVDRCVCVFFPLWHRCHRPTHLSANICALLWIISFLPSGIDFILDINAEQRNYRITDYLVPVNGFLCFPLMVISGLMIFSKICYKSKQRRKRKLLITILITVLFFSIFCFPVSVILLTFVLFGHLPHSATVSPLCACINSSINPLIYYLVGRPTQRRSNKSMKAILQKLFTEEEICQNQKTGCKTWDYPGTML
uniref:G-protein coupled receptors family 1 profile domain-containing protein n=1 Tax=Salvator merianae TaxID=96440 RepID=A0A8D0BKJ9_SALMN